MMWRAFFETVGKVTGRDLLINNQHRGSLAMFLTDGCAAQALALGDILVEMNKPALGGITTTDPAEMVRDFLRLCEVHCDRYNI